MDRDDQRRYLVVGSVILEVVTPLFQQKIENDFTAGGFGSLQAFINSQQVIHTLFHLRHRNSWCCKDKAKCRNHVALPLVYCQWNKLYSENPGPGIHNCHCKFTANPVQLNELDISLSSLILLNCCNLSQPEEEAVQLLRQYKNDYLSHNTTGCITQTEYNTLWPDLVTYVLRLDPSKNDSLIKIEHRPLDKSLCKKYFTFLLDLHQQIEEIKSTMESVHSSIQAVSSSISGLNSSVETVFQAMDTTVQGIDIAVHRTDTAVQGMDTRVEGMDTRVQVMGNSIQGIETSVQQTNDLLKELLQKGLTCECGRQIIIPLCKFTTAECVNAIRKVFLEADRNGSGTLNFREFTEYVWEKKRSISMSKIMTSFSESAKDEITFSDFQKMVQGGNSDVLTSIIEEEIEAIDLNESSVGQFQNQLKQVYSDTDSKELTTYIRDRWKNFATFRRKGNTGTIVMKGGHGMVADLVPGEYSLIDLACFSDLPPLIPKHTVVKGVKWEIGTVPGKSGKITFPPDFNGRVVTDVATTELLRYYDCSFADTKQEKISLLYRHGIQDFTYENGYLEKYDAATNGGAGLERHEFSHLDCPFKIPKRHTLYIPGGVIHCNDYLKGTWRTMLSDETDIDHVHLTRRNDVHGDEIYDNNVETKFQFTFV